MEIINGEKLKKGLFYKFWSRQKDLRILKFIAVFVVVIASVIIIKDEIIWQFSSDESSLDGESEGFAAGDNPCNALGVVLHGDLTTYVPPADLDKNGNAAEDQTASENIVHSIH